MKVSTKTIQRLIVWGMVAIIIISIVVWYVTEENMQKSIRLGTAKPGGLYYRFGKVFKPHLEQYTQSSIQIVKTAGTVENCNLLLHKNEKKRIDIAVLQAGTCDMTGIAAIAPLYKDVVHIVVRKGSGIKRVKDLIGKKVILGPQGSGMRESAKQILSHYCIDINTLEDRKEYFLNLGKTDNSADAAIVTTGIPNPDLGKLLITGKFELLPILSAKAISIKNPYYTSMYIPRGLFAPDIPNKPIQSIATTAFLAVSTKASPLLVKKTLDALYEGYQPRECPIVEPLTNISRSWIIPYHPEAIRYRDPHKGIDILGKFLEWLADLKEILFALIAGIYIIWSFWEKLKKREEEEIVLLQKQQLDSLLNEIMCIEQAHMKTSDPKLLRIYLDRVTNIKLHALKKLSHENLRGDRLFSIFLMQCANVIHKIQAKCIFHFEKAERKGEKN